MWRNFFGSGRISTRAKKVLIFLTSIYYIGVFVALADVAGRRYQPSVTTSNIITGLRSIKSAALMLEGERTEPLTEGVNHIALLATYSDNPTRFLDAYSSRYTYIVSGDVHWVGYKLDSAGADRRGEKVRTRLFSRAKTVGLYGSLNIGVPPTSNDEAQVYHRDNAVWMPVLSLKRLLE